MTELKARLDLPKRPDVVLCGRCKTEIATIPEDRVCVIVGDGVVQGSDNIWRLSNHAGSLKRWDIPRHRRAYKRQDRQAGRIVALPALVECPSCRCRQGLDPVILNVRVQPEDVDIQQAWGLARHTAIVEPQPPESRRRRRQSFLPRARGRNSEVVKLR